MFDASKKFYINGETAISPYYYYRNGLLHARYMVDRCVRLSENESIELKAKMTKDPARKQDILSDSWNFYTQCVGKAIILDGIAETDKVIKEMSENRFEG